MDSAFYHDGEQMEQTNGGGRLAGNDKIEPIAVVGFSMNFPQDATSEAGFWQMLTEGRSAMTEIPNTRFNIDAFYHPNADRLDTLNGRGGHFLKQNIAAFDAPFFSISSAEAMCMDPQQRCLLECAYRALENAGIPMEQAAGSNTSVFVGSFAREYEVLLMRDPELQAKYQAIGTGPAILANRISWFFDFRGPSIPLDTACSSSLNALHLACQSLRSGESSMGLVCGSNLIINPDNIMIPLSNLGFLSPDSRCHSFDHRANGYARGEGIGAVVIKPLSHALRDGNTIRAVIRATGTNQDGRTPGITHPSRDAQEAMIRATYLAGELDLKTTRFFEAHGTGTSVGDPVEASAISAVFKDQRTQDKPLLIGAVKSNIGHLEGASGIAGLIKTILVLEKGLIPPNIWFEQVNPSIPVDKWNIKFPVQNTPWPDSGLRRASVNSFGYGGANCHVVMDDAFHYLESRGRNGKHCTVKIPPVGENDLYIENGSSSQALTRGYDEKIPTESKNLPKLLVWSSSDEAGISRLTLVYEKYLSMASLPNSQDTHLENLAYTLSHHRSRLRWKSFLVVDSAEDLQPRLRGGISKPYRTGLPPRISFIFTGQGAQWFAMGRELFASPTFRSSLEAAEQYLRGLGCCWSLKNELLRSEESSKLDNPALSQPICTVLQIALVDLLAIWQIWPSSVIGHSSGEIAAAYCAGGLSRESAYKIAYYRGLLAARIGTDAQDSGAMLSVALSALEAGPYLATVARQYPTAEIAIGCLNSPKNTTITGNERSIDALKAILDREKKFARKLKVGVAYHSRSMNKVGAEYELLIKDLVPGQCQNPTQTLPVMYSSVTGQRIEIEQLSQASYWVENMVSKVNFLGALTQLCTSLRKGLQGKYSMDLLIEIGPHAALRRPIKDTLDTIATSSAVDYDSALLQGISASRTIMEMVGRLYCKGYQLDLIAVNSPGKKTSQLSMLTDIPGYPFNHSQSYWLESRLSKDFRFRKHGRHELLGTPSSDWNPFEAKWRNIIKVDENPWIRDHTFNGVHVYPAAGMIVMALEGARQVANPALSIQGYRFKDVMFSKPLILNLSPEGVETQLYLRPRKSGQNVSSHSSEFYLYNYSNGEWAEVCSGTIIVEYQKVLNEVDNGKAAEQDLDHQRSVYERGEMSCWKKVNTSELYSGLKTFGMSFGPTFQTLSRVTVSDEGEGCATINVHDWKNKVTPDHHHSHVIHPTALDGCFHLTVVGLSKGASETIPTIVPTHLRDLWISNSLLTKPHNDEIKVYSKTTFQGYREADFSIVALNTTDNEPQIVTEGYRGTATTTLEMPFSGGSGSRHLCFNIDWKPDVESIDSEQARVYCAASVKDSQILSSEFIDDTELICLYFMYTSLRRLPEFWNAASPKLHLRKYVKWMEHHCDKASALEIFSQTARGLKLVQDEAHRESLLANLENVGPEGKLFVTIGRNLDLILGDKIDALDLLFSDKLVSDFYSSKAAAANYAKVASYVDLLAHKDPGIKILEIGAGTGGGTAWVLDMLSRNSDQDPVALRCGRYDYTDISQGFFEGASARFSRYGDRISYRLLDIETDPALQGFDLGDYDLVLASNVLHATTNLDNTLRNTRKLLRPGGKLVLLEPCNRENSRIPFIFGLLPGWWLGTEDHRYWGPLISDKEWHTALSKNGFSVSDMCLRDYQDPSRHMFSVFISTATILETDPPTILDIVIIVETDSFLQNHAAQEVQSLVLTLQGSSCEIVSLSSVGSIDLANKCCLFLPELERSFLYDIHDDMFGILRDIVDSAASIVWVTYGGDEGSSKPESSLVTGLARSICSERDESSFVTLALSQESSTAGIAGKMFKILQRSPKTRRGNNDSEYMEKSGMLYIGRVVESRHLNDEVFAKLIGRKAERRALEEEAGRPLKLTIASPGLLDTLHFVDDDVYEKPLAADEVEIEVKATGLNFKDVMIALGQLPEKTLGLECAGTLSRVGSLIEHLKPGDRVCGVTGGAFSTYVRYSAESVVKIPDWMDFRIAATIPVVYCTAYYALHYLAHLKEGESILIHSGAGGVGQAAIQLAKLVNAKIYVSVGSNEKKELLKDLYGIPDGHFFSSRNMTFARSLKRMTKGRGVDVVLNSLAGESLQKSWECIAPFGRFIEIGKTDIQSHSNLSMSPFARNVMFASVDLGVIADKAKPLMGELMRAVMALLTDKSMKMDVPRPLHVYNGSHLEDAFRFLQSGKNTGKTLIEFRKEDVVHVVPKSKRSYSFDGNATYVIAGGLGGLARSIVRWMIDRNAKNLILLSRSGVRNEAISAWLSELKTLGAEIATPACDISDSNSLTSVLAECRKSMPPIKGCIQGAMVLKDGLFGKMTAEDFNVPFRSKVQGTWNLHTNLPKGMDFFILLSSTSAVIGNRGQSNYASACTYQDALARHRVSQGEKCRSLNLGMVTEIGIVAEQQQLGDALEAAGYQGIKEAEFLALMEYLCDPSLKIASPLDSQMVTGLATLNTAQSKSLQEIFWMRKPLFRNLRETAPAQEGSPKDHAAISYNDLLEAASSRTAAATIITAGLIKKLSKALSVPEDDIDADKPIYTLGVDSLVAIEIRSWFSKEIKADIAVFHILGSDSIAALCLLAAGKSSYVHIKETAMDVDRASEDGGDP